MMQVLTLSTVEDLEAALATFGDDALYRGQVRHFGQLNAPAMNSSFDRLGCDGSMPKWSHYARMALSALVPQLEESDDLEFTQAILQHYGWRSWFLDASSNPAISAWFASHGYSEKIGIDMLEDCFEDYIWLRRKHASYAPSEGNGHLYVLSKARLTELGLRAIDLASIPLPDARPRFHAQAAWLVGPTKGNLPITAIEAFITAPADVFRAYAAKNGIIDTARVFPNAAEDPVLASLLGLPWDRMKLPEQPGEKPKFDVPAFRRTLELPEYFNDGYRKIMPSHYAFYDSKSIAESLPADQGLHVVSVPDIAMYGVVEVSMRFPRVTALLGSHSQLAFEVDALIRLPESGPASHYSKGLSVRRGEDGTIAVSELVVDHPGRQITGVAVNFGWHYNVDEGGLWTRVEHAEQCPCPNTWRHEQHLVALTIIDDLLAKESTA
jgi:hypothetical protein